MREKNQVVPDEMLSKEFLSRFKTESDVSKFLKQLHAQVLEKMLEGEMDARAAGYVATRLMCRLICNRPEMNIRIYLIRLLPI